MNTQNLWDTAKAVLRGKFIVVQSYLKKQEKHPIDNLALHLALHLGKEEQKKISTEINHINKKNERKNSKD